jgi:hypothetical protein
VRRPPRRDGWSDVVRPAVSFEANTAVREDIEDRADEQFDDENFKKRHDSMIPYKSRMELMSRTWTLVNGERWG